MKNNNKWDSLSIKDKADLMKLYVKNGINNLEEIRSHYNKFAEGGEIKNFVEKEDLPIYSSWEDSVEDNWPITMKPTIDYDEIKRRQRWAESQDNPNARSQKGAKGLFQIMPNTQKEFELYTGKKGNPYNPQYNTEMRDWYMNRLLDSKTITKGEPTDSVLLAKQLAAYNWGQGNLSKHLTSQKKKGVDIYKNLDWVNTLPKEPKEYVNFILKNKDTGGPRKNELYNRRPKIFLEY